jgi:hypothetical protein
LLESRIEIPVTMMDWKGQSLTVKERKERFMDAPHNEARVQHNGGPKYVTETWISVTLSLELWECGRMKRTSIPLQYI